MAKTIVAVFDTETAAESAVRDLEAAGVPHDQVGITNNYEAGQDKQEAKGDQGLSDRVLGFFESLFTDDDDRKQASTYAEAWRRGHYVVVADVESNLVDRAIAILNREGTVDLERRAELWKKTGYAGQYDRSAKPYTREERERELATYAEQTQSIPVVQEELVVGKHVTQRGGVRIHSYVEERPVEERVRLREEHLNVQRRPVNRPAATTDAAFQERTVDVTAQGEEAVVEKRARVVEEVVVGKEVEQREETVRDTVRRKDVDVEQVSANSKAKPATAGRPAPADAPRR